MISIVMVSNISHSGVMTQIRRDALRREVARIDGRGNMTRTAYDGLGRVAATIDALTNATTYAYDAMNRVAAITNALGDAMVYEYDHRGNKTYEGGATHPVRYTYDVYGNKTTMTTYRHEPDGGDMGHELRSQFRGGFAIIHVRMDNFLQAHRARFWYNFTCRKLSVRAVCR